MFGLPMLAQEIEGAVQLHLDGRFTAAFEQGGFEMTKVKFGYFEFILNMWATATK